MFSQVLHGAEEQVNHGPVPHHIPRSVCVFNLALTTSHLGLFTFFMIMFQLYISWQSEAPSLTFLIFPNQFPVKTTEEKKSYVIPG